MAVSTVRRAIFIDKDGTLVENVPYNVDPALVRLTRAAGQGLALLARCGYRLIVVSNQSGIARGYFSPDALGAVEARIAELLQPANVVIDAYYYCPHAPDASVARYALRCTCRKPQPGLLRRAAAEHRIDLTRSWLIGDILDDVQAGRRAGCKTILLVNGNETEWRVATDRMPHRFATDLGQAARMIAARETEFSTANIDAAHAHGLD